MLTSLAALQGFRIGFDGDASLRTRLMSGLLGALEKLGATVESSNGKCPFSIRGPLRGGATTVDGTTSQFLTSLLFALPNVGGDSTVDLEFLHEKPYIDITLSWLDSFGIRYRRSDDMLHWEIPGGQHIPAFRRVIPADFSTAAFPLVAAALAGRRRRDPQPRFQRCAGRQARIPAAGGDGGGDRTGRTSSASFRAGGWPDAFSI